MKIYSKVSMYIIFFMIILLIIEKSVPIAFLHFNCPSNINNLNLINNYRIT
jgi:hypothetical protein